MRINFPQVYVEILVRPDDFLKIPHIPVPPPPPGLDPVAQQEFLPFTKKIIPIQCSVSLRNYREASEFRVTLRYDQFPVDPRLLRAVAIKIYAGDIGAKQFSDTQGPIGGRGTTVLIPEVDPGTNLSNELLRGFVDTIESAQGDDNTVELTGRDIRGFFIDAEIQNKAIYGIPATTPIDDVIREIIDGAPGADAVPQNVLEDVHANSEKSVSLKNSAKRLARKVSAINARIASAQALLASAANPAVISQLLIRLNAQLAEATAKLTVAQAKAGKAAAFAGWPQRIGLPGARGIKIVNATGENLPAVGSIKAQWTRSDKTVKKGRKGGMKGVNEATQKHSYWDFIVDMVTGAGYICYFRVPRDAQAGFVQAAELVIDHPKTYHPEVSGTDIHTFQMGLNVDSLDISRSFMGENVPKAIGLKSESAATGEPISVVYPPLPEAPANRAAAKLGGVDKIEIRWYSIHDPVPGPDPEALLKVQAQSIFEQLNKGEMEVAIETECLSTKPSSRNNGYPDMLQLRPADPIRVPPALFTQSTSGTNSYVTNYGKNEAKDQATRVRDLVKNTGMPHALAAAIVSGEESGKLQEVFYCQEFDVDFDADSGFSFKVKGIAYLDSRHRLND